MYFSGDNMIKIVDEKIVPELLDESNILSKEIIEDYDYIKYKNDIKYVISLIKNNALYHITDRARLTLFISEDLKAYTKTENNNKINYNFISYAPGLYKGDVNLCYQLINRFIYAYNIGLNEIERYIIKELEFSNLKLSDEEITYRLMTYKNKYIWYKKSAYIKLGLVLKIDLTESDAIKIWREDKLLLHEI